MKKANKISIITPSYNQGKYLERTILSVLNQTYQDFEYIIIDGGSTDNSVEIIKKHSEKIHYWISEKDNGQTHAINKGLAMSTGDIIIWLNSDDWFEADTLAIVAKYFEDKNTDIVCGYSNLHFENQKIKKRTSENKQNIVDFIAFGHIMQPSTFFRKSAIEKFLPLCENLHYMMDHHLWLQYISENNAKKIKYIDDILANVTMHTDAKSVSQLHKFREDKGAIFNAMFSNSGCSLLFPKKYMKNHVTFMPTAKLSKNELIKINFELLYNNLYFRNMHGKRTKIDVSMLLILITKFPVKFILSIFSKIASK